jgi:hypothetical protein
MTQFILVASSEDNGFDGKESPYYEQAIPPLKAYQRPN